MRSNIRHWLNVFCLLFVVHAHLLHAPGGVMFCKIDNLVVALFAMMAGVSWGSFLKKTRGEGWWFGAKMFLYPYLFWTVVYFSLNYIVLDVVIRHNELSVTLSDIVFFLLTGYAGLHLWFLITLLYAIVITTYLYKFIKIRSAFILVALLLSIVALLIPYFPTVADSSSRYVEYYRLWFIRLFPAFVIGVLVSLPKAKVYSQWWVAKIIIPSIVLLGVVCLLFGGWRGSHLLAATAVVLVASLDFNIPTPKWISGVAPYIMGIYLVHALFTSAVNVLLGLSPANTLSEFYAWPIAVFVFFASWFSVWFMRRFIKLNAFV